MDIKRPNKMMVFMSRQMISCDEAGFLMSKSSDTKLSFKEKMGLRIHLMVCHICRKYEKQLKQINRLMKRYREECTHEDCAHSIPPEQREALIATLEQEMKGGGK